jgi:tRNA 5-methylaminomethyl-2-thiouridine biosynthesis bifunctional protein
LGAGASGNPAGLVMPRLDRGGGAAGELFLAAYLDAVAAYEALGEGAYARCGVEERAQAGDEALADLLDDPPLPEDWYSRLPNGAALHARAGLVRPLDAIDAFLRGARLLCEAPVQRLDRADEGWILRAPDGRALLKADAVVLACGAALGNFAPAAFLPILLSRGQIEWGPGPAPARALASGAYVAPFEDGVLFGATFDPAEAGAAVEADAASRARNLAALKQLAPDIAAGIDAGALRSRAAVRATTPDRMPIAGLAPDADAWLAQYAGLKHGRDLAADIAPPAHAGVYIVGGLGARGLTLAPLLGERIASEMCGEPSPLSRRALDAMHPARFLHRALKRR